MTTITETLNTAGQVSSALYLAQGKTASWTLSTAGLTGYLAIERGDTDQAFETVRLVAGNDTNQFAGPGYFRFRLVAKAGAESVSVSMTDNDDVVFQVPNSDGTGSVLTATDSGLVIDPDGPSGGMVARPVADALRDKVSLLSFIPPNIHEAIRARTNTVNLSTYIQAALDGAVCVVAPAGEYLSSPFQINPRQALIGEGHGATEFKQYPNTAGDLISLKTNTAERVVLRSFSVNGNKANQSAANKGINFSNTGSSAAHTAASAMGSNDPRHLLHELLIYDTKGDGLFMDGRGEAMVDTVWTYRCDGHGIYNNTFDSWFSNLSSGGSGLHGIFNDVSAYDCRFSNVKAWFSGMVDAVTSGDGIHHKGYYCVFSGVEVQDPRRHGVWFNAAGENVFSGHIQSPGFVGNASDGFRLLDARNNVITATIHDRDASPSMPYGVRFMAGGSGVAGNDLTITVRGAQTANYLFETAGFSSQVLLRVNSEFVSDPLFSSIARVSGRIRVKNASTQNFDIREQNPEEIIEGFSSVSRQFYSSAHGGLAGNIHDTIGANTAGGQWQLNHFNGTVLTSIGRGFANGDFGVAGGAWNTGCLRIGAYRLWVDATGDLRIKSSAPTTDLDGAVVGTQS